MNSDLISRQAAIDAIDDIESEVADGDGFQYAKWREYFCDLPSEQPQSTMGQVNDTAQSTNDCISRQAAIDAILAVTGNSSVRELYEHVQEHELSDMWSGGVNAAIDIIIAVPSVQTESKETSSTHKALDTISRQAAIDQLHQSYNLLDAERRLEDLPSAQPDIRLSKIADLVDGTIDHFDLDDAMDLLYQIKDVLDGSDALPSAQPENNCSEIPNNSDTISRQAAIDMAVSIPMFGRDVKMVAVSEIKNLPSAQPEEVIPHRNYKYLSDYWCTCGWHLGKKGEVKYCADCGRKVNWDE